MNFFTRAAVEQSPFDNLTEAQLRAHSRRTCYDDIELTGAVVPSPDFSVMPKEGYRHDVYQDPQTGTNIPVLMAAASRKKLLSLFDDLLSALGNDVDVVLETSHLQGDGQFTHSHEDLYRDGIDLPTLRSILTGYEDLLLEDGCTGIAVLNPRIPMEVQFDEHKLIIVYNDQRHVEEEVLRLHGLKRDDGMKFITEAAHMHASSDAYEQQFRALAREILGEF